MTELTEISEKEAGFKSELSGNAGGYMYDGNGNTITDAHKGINVQYNFLNLPDILRLLAAIRLQTNGCYFMYKYQEKKRIRYVKIVS